MSDGKLKALKVEHPTLPEPRFWILPSGWSWDDLLGRTVLPWIREQIGESRELVTFTVVEEYFTKGPEAT